MRLAKDMLGDTSELLRLIARTNHIQLNRWDLVRVHWLKSNCSHLYNHVFEMAPDHASGEGPDEGQFGLAQTSGPDQSL